MNWFPIILMILGLLVSILVIIFLIKRNKVFFVPSVILLMLSIVLIGLSQMTDGSGGGWNDVIYMVFGVLILIANVVLTSIVLVVRLYRNNKDQ